MALDQAEARRAAEADRAEDRVVPDQAAVDRAAADQAAADQLGVDQVEATAPAGATAMGTAGGMAEVTAMETAGAMAEATAMRTAGGMAEVTAMGTAGAMVEVTAIDRLFPSGATVSIADYWRPSRWISIRDQGPQSRRAGLQAKLKGLNSRGRITNRCLTMRCKSSGAARRRMVRARPPLLTVIKNQCFGFELVKAIAAR